MPTSTPNVSHYGIPGSCPTAEPSVERRRRLMLLFLCAIAIALRLYFAFASPNIAHPDEIYQNQEQAHRLVYGYGIVPWEFREGVRSSILPEFLAFLSTTSYFVLPLPYAYQIGAAI